MNIYRKTSSFKIAFSSFVAIVVFCAEPVSATAAIYQPGETLNPSCLPTDSNCTVATTTAAIPYSSSTAVSVSGGTATSSTLFLGTLGGILQTISGRVQTVANLFYDNVTGRLGIGTASPAATLDITNGATSSPAFIVRDQLGFVGLELRTGTSSLHNIFFGTGAGALNETGASSTAVGYQSLAANTTGSQNTALGLQALTANTTGSNNTAVGYLALSTNMTGENNTAIGWRSLVTNMTGSDNTAVGMYALYSNNGGSENIAFGSESLYSNTDGSYNTALGLSALHSNIEGSSNTAVGHSALYSNTIGVSNIAIGTRSLFSNTDGSDNTALGEYSLYLNTSGSENVTLGSESLYSNTLGSYNAAFGRASLYSNTIGIDNTAGGWQALYSNTTGGENTALGFASLRANTTGVNNTALGALTLYNNTAASGTVAVGSNAAAGTTSYTNQGSTYVGYGAGYGADVGSNFNTFIGHLAGYGVTTGGNNIIVGSAATDASVAALTTGSRNILIGSDIAFPSATGNGQLNIGNMIFGTGLTGTDHAVSSGKVGIGTTTPWGRLSVTGSGTEAGIAFVVADNADTPRLVIRDNGIIGVGTITPDEGRIEVKGDTVCVDTDGDNQATSCIADESDARLKKNIVPLASALDTVLQLRGVSFDWNIDDPSIVAAHPLIMRFSARPHDIGVIAQEVMPIVPEAIDRETIDGFYQVDYKKFVPLLIEAIKEQNAQVAAVETAVFGDVALPGATGSREISVEHMRSFSESWLGRILRSFLASTTNGIETIVANAFRATEVQTERLCVGAVCVTETELRALLAERSIIPSAVPSRSTDSVVETVASESVESTSEQSDPTDTDMAPVSGGEEAAEPSVSSEPQAGSVVEEPIAADTVPPADAVSPPAPSEEPAL